MNRFSIYRPVAKNRPTSEFERRHFPFLTGAARTSVFYRKAAG